MINPTSSDLLWMHQQLARITDERVLLSPSECAEKYRELPDATTPIPGPFRYETTPLLREIVDCLDVRSPVRKVSILKAAQIGATVGIYENWLFYLIKIVQTKGVILASATEALIKSRMERNITPMVIESGLEDVVRSQDSMANNRSGKTADRMEWDGGGFLMMLTGQSPNASRSTSVPFLGLDEIDAFRKNTDDGSMLKTFHTRTDSYPDDRKILQLSTPNLKESSYIYREYMKGDRRKWMVNCVDCGEQQELKFYGENLENGIIYGLAWEYEESGKLDQESVGYVCMHCGFKHLWYHKSDLINSGEWIPTAIPDSPSHRSYHIHGICAPKAMKSWVDIVESYLEAYDPLKKKIKDYDAYQVFYNNQLGWPWEDVGNRMTYEKVDGLRRAEYSRGEVPNRYIKEVTGHKVHMLTCAVDVHDSHLNAAVVAWVEGTRAFCIDYFVIEGDCKKLDTKPWAALDKLIAKKYVADTGEEYQIAITLVDSNYMKSLVVAYCEGYSQGVFPILGRPEAPKGSDKMDFWQMKDKGRIARYGILVNRYKDTWANAFDVKWDKEEHQPSTFFNAPQDFTPSEIKELMSEQKRAVRSKQTGIVVGHEWYRPSGKDNELWDLLVYNHAALEIHALRTCTETWGMNELSWPAFWAGGPARLVKA